MIVPEKQFEVYPNGTIGAIRIWLGMVKFAFEDANSQPT